MKTLKTTIKNSQNGIYVKLTGEVKGVEAFNLKSELQTYAQQNKSLSIDVTDVTDISLTGLNAILMSRVYALAQNNEVILILSKHSKLNKQLKLTKMSEHFTLKFAAQYIYAV